MRAMRLAVCTTTDTIATTYTAVKDRTPLHKTDVRNA